MFNHTYKTTKLAIFFLILIAYPTNSRADDFYFINWLTGDNIGDQFFHIANGHGDVNGDSFEDILIGGSGAGGPGGDSCYAKLFFGGCDFDTIPDLIFQPDTTNYFGGSCAFIGDVNADGYDDILIGDPDREVFWWGDGAAYLYFGGVEMDTVPDMFFQGEYWYHLLGANVSGAGDVNGDGYDDWLINSPFDDFGGTLGRIYLYYGGPDLDDTCDVYFEGEIEGLLQFDNPELGDINGDGYDDLLFWNWGFGSVELHLGSSDMDTVPDLLWSDYYYSLPVSGVGDVNDDGFNDWIINCSNRLNLFFGSEYPDTIPDLIFEIEPPCNYFQDHAVGGDVNGDGIDDIVIGAYMGTSYGGHGQVLGYSGGSELDNHYDYFFDSGIEDEWIGGFMGLSDINGDSVYEILTGGAGGGYGRVWILTTQDNWQSVGDVEAQPECCAILECYPNPFNPSTAITYNLQTASWLELSVYDITGREVAIMVDGYKPAGEFQVVFDASELSSGIYFAKLTAGEFTKSQKLLLIK